jgi:hypothetical protein
LGLLACWWTKILDLFASAALLRYSACVGEVWTEEAVLRESERWVHVPQDGRCVEDGRRLLVHLPERWGTSRVWRSWAVDEERAGDLIEETVGEVRAAGGGRILWHTGDRVAPPFLDECLSRYGFRKAEEQEKLRRRERGEPSMEGTSLAMRFAAYMNPPSRSGGEYSRGVVAVAGAQGVGETLRLWGAGTCQRFRGRGAYRALVLERCRGGRRLGATLALAKTNVATSAPILKRAGFCPVGTERRHELEIQS